MRASESGGENGQYFTLSPPAPGSDIPQVTLSKPVEPTTQLRMPSEGRQFSQPQSEQRSSAVVNMYEEVAQKRLMKKAERFADKLLDREWGNPKTFSNLGEAEVKEEEEEPHVEFAKARNSKKFSVSRAIENYVASENDKEYENAELMQQ